MICFSSNSFDIANDADDCSPFEFSSSIEDVINKLKKDSLVLIEWYESNYLKPNPVKWHLLLSELGDEMTINIANDCISNSTDQKILGVIFDNKLNFNTHVSKLCKRAGQKIHA